MSYRHSSRPFSIDVARPPVLRWLAIVPAFLSTVSILLARPAAPLLIILVSSVFVLLFVSLAGFRERIGDIEKLRWHKNTGWSVLRVGDESFSDVELRKAHVTRWLCSGEFEFSNGERRDVLLTPLNSSKQQRRLFSVLCRWGKSRPENQRS